MSFTSGSGGMSFTSGSGGMSFTSGSGGMSFTSGSGGMSFTSGSGGMSFTSGSGGMSFTVSMTKMHMFSTKSNFSACTELEYVPFRHIDCVTHTSMSFFTQGRKYYLTRTS